MGFGLPFLPAAGSIGAELRERLLGSPGSQRTPPHKGLGLLALKLSGARSSNVQLKVHAALHDRIGFGDRGFGLARICASSTNRRFLAHLRGRHLARPATIVGTI